MVPRTATRAGAVDSAPSTSASWRAVVEHAPDIVALVSAEGVIEFISPAVTTLSGYHPEELVGRSVFAVLDPGSREDDLAFLAEAVSAPGPHGPAMFTALDRDGRAVHFELMITNRLDDPEVGALVAVARETGERLDAEERLRRNADWARALVQRGSDLVLVLDQMGSITWASPSVRESLGFAPESIIGKSAFELVAEADRSIAIEAFVRKVAGQTAEYDPLVARIVHANGEHRTVELEATDMLADPAVRGVVVTGRDVTDRYDAEEAVARSERRFRALVQESTDIVLLVAADGRLAYASPSVERVIGVPPANAIGRHVLDWVHPEDRAFTAEVLARAIASKGLAPALEIRLRAADGTWRHVELVGNNLLDDPDVGGLVVSGRDVSDRRRAEDLVTAESALLESIARGEPLPRILQQLADLVERLIGDASCSVGVLDPDGVVRHPAAATLPPLLVALLDDVEPASSLGTRVRELSHGALLSDDIAADPGWQAMASAFVAFGLRGCWALPALATESSALMGVVTVFVPAARPPSDVERRLLDRVQHLAAIAIQRSRYEAELQHRALHDDLTGLPNRALLLDRLEQSLARARRHGTYVAVLFVDLDQFKVVNDSLGHAAGDRLLLEVSDRFQRGVRGGDTVARFGGDEFVVLCEDIENDAAALAVAEHLASQLRERPLRVSGTDVFVNCSIGIALATDGEPEALIRNADAAMYRAKEEGRNRVALFEEAMHRRMVRRFELERELRAAFANGELRLWYQPRVRLDDRRIVGVEALLRREDETGAIFGAADIVPTAEESGFITKIGAWVLREACVQAADWLRVEPDLIVSVNVSGRQLADPGLVELVADTLAETGVPADRLCLEVTEGALACAVDAAARVLATLKGLGVRLAIDDFGTGYATLDYVRRFSMADELKIDRSFVEGLDEMMSPDAAIVSAAIVLADALGFQTVAEGVETEAQLEVLRRLGCAHGQGYLFSRAVPAGEIAALLVPPSPASAAAAAR
jgi:diguanylate cyclase (GGDEF)-like protein/PAS domain S-box-containing protein